MKQTLLSRIVSAIRSKPGDTDRATSRFFGFNESGISVNHDSAMQIAAVWACIDAIAAPLASSDWNVYAGGRGDSNSEALPEDGLQYILNTRWNDEMTAQSGKRATIIAAVGYGNGYAEIERDLANRVIGLWPVFPDTIEPRRDTESGLLFYRAESKDGGFTDIPAEDIYHVRGPGLTGFMGDDVVNRAIKTLAQAVAMDRFTASYFGNSAQLGTVFMYKNAKLDDNHYERLKSQLEKRHVGAGKAFTSAIFDGGEWDVKQIGSDAEKAQIINARHLSIEDICRWFHVPPHKIAHLLRSSNNNIEHQGLEFTRDTLRPWVKEIEQEADFKLVPMRVKKYVELDLDWAQQGDYKSRMEAYAAGRNMGVFSANDILRKLGENTIGAEGDIRMVQGANVRLEDVGAAYAVTPPGRAAPPADDPEDPEDPNDAVTTAWLQSVFSRIENRKDKRAEALQKEGHRDWQVRARESSTAYAVEQVNELASVLSVQRLAAAHKWAAEVIGGCETRIAVMAVMMEKT